MDLKKKTRNGSGFYLKNPDPTRDPTRIKTRIKPGTQNYKNTLLYIYIYSYNLTLTNPHFFNLQSSAAAAHTVRSTHTQHPHAVRSTHTHHPTQSAAPHRPTQSAAPHTVPFPYFSSVHTVRSVHTVLRSVQSQGRFLHVVSFF